jgi:nucleotide-binding universal stress UspA family protein
MKTLLLLTDFSETAESAAQYACTLVRQLNISTIVLYHSYPIPVPVTEPSLWVGGSEIVPQVIIQNLMDLEKQIREKIPKETVIRHRADNIPLSEINEVVTEEDAGLVVMGTLNKNRLEEIILGSNAIAVCQSCDCPVILVPAHIDIHPVGKIIFACDMKEVKETIPEANLKNILDEFNVPLTVINVDYEDKHFKAETTWNTKKLHDMLQDYDPDYNNISNDNIIGGIIEFARQYPSAIVLLIAKAHNFMEGLFYRSLTRKLASVSPFPLLILRELTKVKSRASTSLR